jgi:sugar/nucleoside kinase (ribokinase family)
MILKQFDVAVIGNVGIDTNIYLKGNEIDFAAESNFTENIDYVGQAGGYTARGFAQLGYKTAFIGYIGNDFLGRYILDEFKIDGINMDAIFVDPAGTSRSINFMYKNGLRKNFYDGKNHMNLKPDVEKCLDILKAAQLAHFHIPNWARYLLPLAKERGLKISCDIQDIIDVSDPYRADFIKYADVLFMSGVNQKDPKRFLTEILNNYPQKIVICGMGADGCIVGTQDGIDIFPAVELSTKIIDINGAGDGLAVGFLSGYYFEQMGLVEAAHRAQIVARYTCSVKASTSSLITQDILQDLLKRQSDDRT